MTEIRVYDICECFMALCVAILKKVPPERAFDLLDYQSKHSRRFNDCITQEDLEDMVKLRNEGVQYWEIGEMYGISKDAAFRRIKKFKEKNEVRSWAY